MPVFLRDCAAYKESSVDYQENYVLKQKPPALLDILNRSVKLDWSKETELGWCFPDIHISMNTRALSAE